MKFDPNKDCIGEGGLCCVYRARYEKFGWVAVKKLKTDAKYVHQYPENCIQREVRCLRNLLHNNVVQIIGIIWEPEYYAVVLEYNAYGDLLNFMSNFNLNFYLKAKLLFDVSKGIKYLHWLPKQIIHNDIKASNILISDDVTAKLSDFGMAEWSSFTTEFSQSQPQSKYLPGATATHKSPERWCNINESTTKCDVYSYGILIWETYSEKKPFANSSNEDIRLAVTEGQRPDKSLLKLKSPVMIDLMQQCWNQKPNERPEMQVVVTKLGYVLSHEEPKKLIFESIEEITKSSANEIDESIKNSPHENYENYGKEKRNILLQKLLSKLHRGLVSDYQ